MSKEVQYELMHGVSSFDACLSLHNNTASSLVQSWGD